MIPEVTAKAVRDLTGRGVTDLEYLAHVLTKAGLEREAAQVNATRHTLAWVWGSLSALDTALNDPDRAEQRFAAGIVLEA